MKIKRYSFGQMEVNGKSYRSDLIILPDRVVEGWWRQAGHSLVPEDLVEVVAIKPNILIVGTGAYGRMKIPTTTTEYLTSIGLEIQAAATPVAVESFNRLREAGLVVGAFHLTC
jgi:hypothetical protein